jgi:nitrate/TMAO reductase-like tetraheme cytochrome c subunit
MDGRAKRWGQRIVVAAVVGLPLVAALLFLAVQVSSQPPVCGTCHNMRPYYESWRHSSHHDVPCVECHIPPGIESEIRKKYEALSMVASYFTGTYGSKPWGDVADASCLRSGCHAKRLLLGRELYGRVLFDHQPHLAEMRRGKQLRCTSCHSQIVQGQHIAVTSSTCFLCHFKDTLLNEGSGRCVVCHDVPEGLITTGGLSFDHGDVTRVGMNCTHCHEGVVRGGGEVPRERCLTCHNEPARLARYAEAEHLHRTHVTERSVECLDCHIEIAHGVPPREQVLATACESCHTPAAGHAAVRDLYRGIGAHGVTPLPAPMYLAGIRCEACHSALRDDHKTATEVSCMGCHGPRYLTIYRSWQAGLSHRLEGVTAELAALGEALERAGGTLGGAGLSDAAANLALLRRGRPIHNPGYAVEIMEKAHDAIVAAWSETGAGAPPPGRPWQQAPYEAECLRCHFGVEYLATPAFGAEFPHAPHVVRARLRCTTCHGDRERHGALELEDKDCAECHDRVMRPMAGVSAEGCLECHPAAVDAGSRAVAFPHERHIAAGLDCSLCHQGADAVPHLDFARSATAVPPLGHELCGTCHGGDVPGADGAPPEDARCDIGH